MDQRIEARIAALEAELLNLKQAVATDVEPAQPTSDRRGMLKLVAVSAAGAMAGAAIFNAQPAAAITGDPVLVGGTFTSDTDNGITISGTPYGIVSDGAAANALFNGSGPEPVGGVGGLGELYVDANGNWWVGTVDSATDALWRKIAGPGTAGSLHVLPKPVRVYDSRPGQVPTTVGPKAPLSVNGARTIDTTLNTSGVPTTANAVLINLTIAGPLANGFGSAWPSGAFPGTSSINFSAGQNIAATTVVGCAPGGTIQILANAVTDVLVDVIGYYQ